MLSVVVVFSMQGKLLSSSVCYRHTILLSPHEAQRRVGFKRGVERKKKSAPKARFLVFGGDGGN